MLAGSATRREQLHAADSTPTWSPAAGNFSQYLWVRDDNTAADKKQVGAGSHIALTDHSVQPVGIGLFGRADWAPEDRNAIDQFYSFGIGGFGVLLPGRDGDQCGVGGAGSHIWDDLPDLNVGLRTWEHAVEAFYNFQLTPAAHLSLNSQFVRPASQSVDTAWTLGTRLQLDF